MVSWLRSRIGAERKPAGRLGTAVGPTGLPVARFEPAPEFSTTLPVDAPGAPGRAGAEALYAKWATKWQEFCEPASLGGLPTRGELLPYWDAGEQPEADAVSAWQIPAWRIALGVELVGHLEPVLDAERCLVGFCCQSEELAQTFVALIAGENLEARVARAHPTGAAQREACDVVLPCRPDAPEGEVNNAIVASVKSSHLILCPAQASPTA